MGINGGKRPGAGRKPGSANTKTRAIADKAAEGGELPLEYMLKLMRDPMQTYEVRMDMAKAAAPYVHPRLASTETKNQTTISYVARVPNKAANPIAWQEQQLLAQPKH